MTSAVTSRQPVRRFVEHVMGMPISLALRGAHAADDEGLAAWEDVVRRLRAVDEVFSTYRPDSAISRLASGAIDLADCPPEVAEVFGLAETARAESGGAFDIRRASSDGTPVLDPSGIVKGWGVERAADRLRELEDTDFCLSAGGDMVCEAPGTDGPAWRVGIEDPLDPTKVLATVLVRYGAVATSGVAHRGAHIVDPRTGVPPNALASVTVLAERLVWADVDATAAFVLGVDAIDWLLGRGRRGIVVWGMAGRRSSARSSTSTEHPEERGSPIGLLDRHDLAEQQFEACRAQEALVVVDGEAAEVHRHAEKVVLDAVALAAGAQTREEEATWAQPPADALEELGVPRPGHMDHGVERRDRVDGRVGQ